MQPEWSVYEWECIAKTDFHYEKERAIPFFQSNHQARLNENQFKCPIKGTSEDLSRSYPLMAVKLGKEVATS